MAFISDSFTESSNTALQSHTPETGGSWAKHPNFSTGATVDATEDRVAGDSSSATAIYYNDATPPSAEYDVESTIRFTSTSNPLNGVIGRIQTGSTTFIQAFVNNSPNPLVLQEVSAGSTVTEGSWTSGFSINTDYEVKLELRNGTNGVKAYVDGTERIAITASTVTSAGYAGLRTRSVGRLDNFVATDAGGGAITGDASITLGALTASGSGSLAIGGSAAITLGALTSAAAGSLAISGSAAITLDAATVAAEGQLLAAGIGSADITLASLTAAGAGALAISGQASVTLDAATVAADGQLLSAGTGAAAITLDSLTATAAGKLAIAGASAVTLDSLTVDAAGSLAAPDSRIGTAAITLADATATAAGKLAISGQAAITLDGATTAATGSVAIAGALGITLGDLIVDAAGYEITPDTRIGTAAITLADLTVAAFNAPALTRTGNRRLRESSPRLQMNDMPTGARFRKGRLPSVY